jgi:hypothetical protein
MAVPGLWYRYYDPPMTGGGSVMIENTNCVDYHKKEVREDGTLPPTDFELVRKTYQPIRVSGTRYDSEGDLVLRFNSRAYTLEPSDPSIGWQKIEGNKTTNDFIRDLLSSTNPFRPTVSVPLMIKDLAEAATLLELSAKYLAALPGAAYLNIKFGWEQTINDIYTLAKITKQIEHRIKEFNSLVRKGGLSRSMRLGTFKWSGAKFSNWAVGTDYYVGIYSNWQAQYTSRVWGSVRWRPKGYYNPIPAEAIPVGPLESFNAAVRSVFDLGPIDHHTVWNLIPFSWLVDYFTSVSDAMLAVQDSDVVEPYDICIMRHRTSHKNIQGYQYNPGPHDHFNVSGGSCQKIYKLRTVRDSAPEYEDLLRFGWFTTNQAETILALLSSLRR